MTGAAPPPQPSPVEGEGDSADWTPSPSTGEGRGGGATHHACEKRHFPGAIPRARRLRREMTDVERKLWMRLREQQLKFRRQVPIGRYVVDFPQHASKLIVELDGGQHAEANVQLKDVERTAWLTSRGYRVLRFWNSEVNANLDGVVETILHVLSPSPLTGEGRGGGAAPPLGSP